MSKGNFNLDDYVDVAERIRIFRSQYPDGSLQSRVIRWPYEGPIEQALQFIAVEARAYRTPEDPRPGYGLAWEPFPGKTPYTKDSELMVAETSAWGRAIVAVLAADTKRGVASKQEVRNRRKTSAEQTPAGAGAATSLPEPNASAGAADTRPADTWDGINAKVSGGSDGTGEGPTSSPDSSGGESEASEAPLANGSPSDLLDALWDEALSYELTKARVTAILRQANQPISSWEDVDARQLESIVRPYREVAKR